MDDLSSKPVRAAYYCLCCCVAVPALVVSLALGHLAQSAQRGYATSVSNLGGNWETDMLFGLTADPGQPLGPGQYLEPVEGRYPGSSAGCLCELSASSLFFEVRLGLKRRACNLTETMAGCAQIPPVPAQPLGAWREGRPLFAVRQAGTTFLESFARMRPDGSCAPGFERCGSAASVSRGACLPAGGGCPLSDLSREPRAGAWPVELPGLRLWASRDPELNPLVDALVSEDHLCFDRTHFASSPGRSVYALLEADYSLCRPDPAALELDELGELDYFALNRLDLGALRGFGASNDFRYRLFTARYVEWSPDCADMMPEIQKIGEENRSLTSSFKTHYVLMWVAGSLSLLLLLRGLLLPRRPADDPLYLAAFAARAACCLLLAPTALSLFRGTAQVARFLDAVVAAACTSQTSNELLAELAEAHRGRVFGNFRAHLGLWLLAAAVEAAMLFLRLRLVEDAAGPGPGSAAASELQELGTPMLDPAPRGPAPFGLAQSAQPQLGLDFGHQKQTGRL